MPRSTAKDRTQVLPFAEASDLQLRIARSFALVNDWNAALNGHFPIAEVMDIFTRQVSARNVTLYRLVGRSVRTIASSARAHDRLTPENASGALARYLVDHHTDALSPGSIWRLKDLRKEEAFASNSAKTEWNARPEIIEVSVIVLEHTETQTDLIEMIFDSAPNPVPELPPSIITQAMADAWELRAAGLITRTIKSFGRTRRSATGDPGRDVLSPENPFALSRAEQRVCQLLADGTKPKEIAQTLGVSVSTVRSHLRNLFAKTDTSGQIDLIALISEGR